ncbi:hypothetical protein OAL67_00460 [bacterium]|nr:hypothetical protein [bacterium]
MTTTLIPTIQSFLNHNFILVLFGSGAVFFLLLTILKPSRFNTFMFVGFLALAFKFEYDKHLFLKIKTDMIDLIFPPGQRFKKYKAIMFLLDHMVPALLGVFGWGLLVLAPFFRRKKKD